MRAWVVAVAAATSVLLLTARRGFSDDIEDLGELLVKKGVISQEDWQKLRAEQKQKKTEAAAAAPHVVVAESQESIRTPGLSDPCGSRACFAARSAAAKRSGTSLSYHGL